MTFQVGIVASDGIVLASDMLRYNDNAGLDLATTDFVQKIVTVDDKTLAYCCAGDELSILVGKEIQASIVASSYQHLAEFFVDCARRAIDNTPQHKNNVLVDGTLLIACGDPEPQLWKFAVVRGGSRPLKPERLPSLGWATAGDVSSYATFFLKQYLDGYTRPQPTMNRLALLAAHTVISAARLNPKWVDGLEMVFCGTAGPKRLSDDQIETLKDSSIEIYEEIKRRLLLGAKNPSLSAGLKWWCSRPDRPTR